MPRIRTQLDVSLSVGRRSFLSAAGAATVTLMSRSAGAAAQKSARESPPETRAWRPVSLTVNGQQHQLSLDPRTSLLDALREQLRLTGTKKGCDHGQCGACTVHIDGRRELACMTFAVMAEGRKVTTIEGIASSAGSLHPMQQAFIDHDAFQCGYCTPGQIMSAIACVGEGHADTDSAIREYMSGNICRCAAYPNIVAAIKQAKRSMES